MVSLVGIKSEEFVDSFSQESSAVKIIRPKIRGKFFMTGFLVRIFNLSVNFWLTCENDIVIAA